MASSCSLRPLRSIPDLIPACVKILKDTWPHCKAELLYDVAKEELNTVPCSYGLVQHPDDPRDKDILVGHVRAVPVINRKQALYGESMCIDNGKRGLGISSTNIRNFEELLANLGYREFYVCPDKHRTDYFFRNSYVVHNEPVQTLGANLLQTGLRTGSEPYYVSWHGNVLYPGWESAYEGGAKATEKEMRNGSTSVIWYVKYVHRSTDFEK